MIDAKRTVLMVEDEAIIAMDVAAFFRSRGWTVLGPVGTLSKAEAILDETRPDFAILDVNINGKQSFPLAERLKAHGVPFVFMTGYESSLIPESLSDATILTKPVRLAKLEEAVDRASGKTS